MAQIHLDRIKKKYGWTGENYKKLISKILEENTKNIHNNIGRILVRDLKAKAKTLRIGKQILVPDITAVFPKRAIHLRKAAEKGELLTDTLRDRLTGHLRETLNKPEFEHKKGRLAGAIKEELVTEFQNKITETFDSYTKKRNKKMPSNLATIARTEVRSALSVVKHEYMTALVEKNPDLDVQKVWIHRGSSRPGYHPRGHHEDLDGTQIPMDEDFEIITDDNERYFCAYPHDDRLPAGEVINCGCEMKYIFVKRKARESNSLEI
jgi:hypothetical protein